MSLCILLCTHKTHPHAQASPLLVELPTGHGIACVASLPFFLSRGPPVAHLSKPTSLVNLENRHAASGSSICLYGTWSHLISSFNFASSSVKTRVKSGSSVMGLFE